VCESYVYSINTRTSVHAFRWRIDLKIILHCIRKKTAIYLNPVRLYYPVNIITFLLMQIAVVSRSKTWTFFARWNAGIVGSNPTQGIDVCLHLLCVRVVLCVGSGFATGWSPVQIVLLTVYRIFFLLPPYSGARFHIGANSWLLSLLIFSQAVWLFGRVISSSQGLYLNTGQHKHSKMRTHNKHLCPRRDSNP
jgi:hypothetical protein